MTTTTAPALSADQAARIAAVKFNCRVAQLVGEMTGEGWDRRTATAIAKEFAKAGA